MDSAQSTLPRVSVQARTLRIACVTETYPPEINGVAMTIGRMVAGLVERRHSIQLVRPRQHRGDEPARRPGLEEFLVHGMALPRYDAVRIGLPATRALTRLWSEQRPDVVHVVTEGPLGWSAISAARKLKIPVCSDFHTNFHTYSGHYGAAWLNTPIAAYLRRFHNKTAATLVPTRDLRRELENLGLLNLRVVSRGVDTVLFSPRRRNAALRASWGAGTDDIVVLSVGRVAAEKNLPFLVRTFEVMRAANPRLRLVVVGDGPERAPLQAAHPGHVFAGMRVGEELAEYYASADIFLFPSTTETFGNVTLEAMASALAVVAYDYAAAAEHIRHGTNGLLADFNDGEAFVRLAVGLANDRSRAKHLGANARAVTEKLDWVWIVRELECALLEIVDSGGSYASASRMPLERIVYWDGALALKLNAAARRAGLRAAFRIVSRLGDGVFWYALMLALLVGFGADAAPAVVHMIAAGLCCTALYKGIKARTLRPRPYEAHPEVILFAAPLDRFSFPSGHTLHAVAFALVALAYYPFLAWLVVPFTLLVAASRVTLGLHYPSDVLAGALVGAAAIACASFLVVA